MCIMKIHAESTSANAIQAMAHNADTNCRDLEQLAVLLDARSVRPEVTTILRELRSEQENIADRLWLLWRNFVPRMGRAEIHEHVGEEALPENQSV